MTKIKKYAVLLIALLLLIQPFALEAAGNSNAVLYKGETVLELHSRDGAYRSYQKVTDPALIKSIVSKLNSVTVPADTSRSLGFLVVTDKGKYDIHFPKVMTGKNTLMDQLVQLSIECNVLYPRNIQWLAYMSTAKITRVQYTGPFGGAYTNKASWKNKHGSANFDSKNSATLGKVSALLKELTFSGAPEVSKLSNNPVVSPGECVIKLEFTTGVTYYIIINKDSQFMSIESSDMKEQTIFYRNLSAKQLNDFFDAIAGLSETKISYY
ncbi:MAG: hypothetical protein LBC56_01720 [Oscillospiraceae bacterium]|nr:hypothetical protein [Oscillospiraceae bacterium]